MKNFMKFRENAINKFRLIIRILLVINITLVIAIYFFPSLGDYLMPSTNSYDEYPQIREAHAFQKTLRTHAWPAYAYGKLEAIDTVTFPELNGQYMYIKKVKEELTLSLNNVGNPLYRHDEWEEVNSETKKCKQVKFLSTTFDSDEIKVPDARLIKTIMESSKVRYKYYAVKAQYTGTIYLNNTASGHFEFYNKSINQTIISLKKHDRSIIMKYILFVSFLFGICDFSKMKENATKEICFMRATDGRKIFPSGRKCEDKLPCFQMQYHQKK